MGVYGGIGVVGPGSADILVRGGKAHAPLPPVRKHCKIAECRLERI